MVAPALPHSYGIATLNHADALLFLTRLHLPHSLATSPPSFSLLAQVLLAHLEQVPKDTSSMHVPEEDWATAEAEKGKKIPIVLGSNFKGMPVGVQAFDRIVKQNKGAFCFALNPTFASLLRFLGFRVSEMVARVYQVLGKNPDEHEEGWKWGTGSHEILVVDWEGEDSLDTVTKQGKRWLVDTGFGGGGCSIPIELKDGATILGLNDYEAYTLRYGPLQLSPNLIGQPIDVLPGWTLLRRVPVPGTPITLPITSASPGYWSPLFFFHQTSISLIDFTLYHLYSAYHPNAAFTGFFLITKLLEGTGGARRSIMFNSKEEKEGKVKAKVHTTGGRDAKGSTEERDVVWVGMEVGEMKEHLEKEWGFIF